jgi:hypothetical protein
LLCDNASLDHYNSAGDFDPCCCDDTCMVTNRQPRACWGQCPIDEPQCALNPDGGADGPIFEGCFEWCAAPRPPDGWSDPAMTWIGLESDQANAPQCPSDAPVVAFEGHDAPNAPAAVCSCSCGPLTGHCQLPSTITVSSLICPGSGPSAVYTPFDPPSDWDGGCVANDPIPAGAGVESVSIGPLTLDEGCSPISSTTPQVAPLTWTTFVRACTPATASSCQAGAGVVACEPEDGFQSCVSHEGNVACPTGSPFSQQYVFYGGALDTRGCSPCTCLPPSGSTCFTDVEIFPNDVCQGPPAISVPFTSINIPWCAIFGPGFALGSKNATAPVYTAGGASCTALGGAPIGAGMGTTPVTFCCAPPPPVPPTQ